MSDVPSKALRRAVRLMALPAGHAGRATVGLGRRLAGQPAELVAAEVQARTAAQLFRTLGELKGGAMKLGQALSAMEALLPAELAGPYREALIRLQEAAPPLPTVVLHRVLAEELGTDWRGCFAGFDDQPAAAASIGQVHRATWNDGRDVAVKIQYPGVAEALTADLRQLDRVLPLGRLSAPAIDFRDLLGRLRERLVEELDYEREGAAQARFARAFCEDPDIAVPDVVEVRPRVLVTEWVPGRALAEIIENGTPQQRNDAGLKLVRLLLSSPQRAGRIHGDPHPGNFRVLDDGRLAVLDFGSSESMPDGWPPRLGRLLRAGRDGHPEAFHSQVLEVGLLAADAIDPGSLLALVDPWLDVLRRDRFHFDRSWLQHEVRTWSDPRGAGGRLQRRTRIPVRHLLVQRVAFGLLGVLTSLDATVPVRAEMERWMPELD